jgi:CheY-like chemotaxis protein
MVEYRQNFNAMKLSAVHRKPLNVGLVAKICRVSKKTVLNWIYRDALKAFTTLGGHYRVWPGDLNAFIAEAGLEVPFQFVDERKTTFLLIDDDPVFSKLLREALITKFPTADVIMTDDGYEGLVLIGEKRPNVLFLDLRMPKVEGFQVLALLKERRKVNDMRIIVLSAYLDNGTRARLVDTVADRAWDKSENINGILQSVEKMINEPAGGKYPRKRSGSRMAAHTA